MQEAERAFRLVLGPTVSDSALNKKSGYFRGGMAPSREPQCSPLRGEVWESLLGWPVLPQNTVSSNTCPSFHLYLVQPLIIASASCLRLSCYFSVYALLQQWYLYVK